MAQKAKFEIYESLSKRKKTFAVIPFNYTTEQSSAAINYLKRVNHCSSEHVVWAIGFVWKDELYFENPAIPGAKIVSVFSYVR